MLSYHSPDQRLLFQLLGKRVLELGAGCGLVGMAAGVLGASHVIMTDLPDTMTILQRNIDRHYEVLSGLTSGTSGFPRRPSATLTCMACDWCRSPPSELLTTITTPIPLHDVILVADCVWMQELVAPLLQTLRVLTEVSLSHQDEEPQNEQFPAAMTTTTTTTTTATIPSTVLISYQRRGKPTHEQFWAGIHSLFSNVHEVDVSAIGLTKPESIFLLECHR
jgi:Lysine methyltransferase